MTSSRTFDGGRSLVETSAIGGEIVWDEVTPYFYGLGNLIAVGVLLGRRRRIERSLKFARRFVDRSLGDVAADVVAVAGRVQVLTPDQRLGLLKKEPHTGR
jgi:hypothetical protein